MKEINLGELEEQSPFQRVGITVKVLDVADVTSLDTDRQFQTVPIADQSGTAELDLWQEYIGVVTTGKHMSSTMQWSSSIMNDSD